MNNLKEEIKKRTDIVQYIGTHVNLKRAGRNFKGNCPFHKEKTPSFVVSPDRQIWHCFGSCGEGGDVISFLMKWENISYVEALSEFAQQLHLPMDKGSFDDSASRMRARLFSANSYAAQFFSYILSQSRVGEKAMNYLKERNIRPEIIKKFELGYSPSSWDSLTRYLQAKSFTQKELIDAGLVIKSDRGSIYDRFRGRLMFPIRDVRSNIVGFSGRILDADAKAAKYINTQETVLYHKRESLYGIHIAKEAIKDKQAVILVEGEFDMITPYQYGVDNIVAIKGSAVTKEQLMLIKRYTNRVYLALDADAAGEEAIKRAIEEAENLEFELGVIVFEKGKDPDEAVRIDQTGFKKALEKPVPVYDYIIDFYRKKFPEDDAFARKNIGESVGPFLTYIKNPIVESYYIRKLAGILEVDEVSIRVFMRRQKAKKTGSAKQFRQSEEPAKNRQEKLQKYLLSQLLQSENKKDMIAQISPFITPDIFSFPAYRQIYELLIADKDAYHTGENEISRFIEKAGSSLKTLIDELYLYASADVQVGVQSMEKLAFEIKANALKEEIKRLLDLPTSDETEKKLTEVNVQLKELEKTGSKIYNT